MAAGDIPKAVDACEGALAALRAMDDISAEIDLLADHGDTLLASRKKLASLD